MFIPIAFVLFFHHHVNNDAYFLKRGVSIYYLISEKKVEQKVTQKNFNQHVIPENLRWAFSYINLQYVRKTMIAQQYNVVWAHFRKLNKKNLYIFTNVFVWVGKDSVIPFQIIVASVSLFCQTIYFICFLLLKIKFDFVLIIGLNLFIRHEWCETFWCFGCNENIWCQNMFDRMCLCCVVVFIHMKCQHGFYYSLFANE